MSRTNTGPDGLRLRERELLERAVAGEPLDTAHVAALVRRLGATRIGHWRAWNRDDLALRAEAFDEVCDGFAVLLAELDVTQQRAARAQEKAHAAESRLLNELRRVKEEREQFREDARNETAHRLALQKRLAERTAA